VALEPGSWRHFFRLGHASWGDERLRAAAHTLALYPDFAFAHFQSAMVHVARGHLAEAETVLRQGAAVQDRQIERGERYPALGLHWLLGLVRLAQDDVEEAIEELDCELVLAVPHRLYGREYAMHVYHARGACFLRTKHDRRAADSFREALRLYPEHGPSLIGLALATRTRASDEFDPKARQQVESLLERLDGSRPVEAAVVHSLLAAALCDRATVGQVLVEMLDAAPAGFAGWTLPVEPLLTHLIDAEALRAALERLAQRAG
jgi:tetratricopeptide (TPR) repeat protein